jgi:hypothetical protein
MRPSQPDSHGLRQRAIPSAAEEAETRKEEVEASQFLFPWQSL